jgi:hypothetical protein
MATRQALNEYDDWQDDSEDDAQTIGGEGPGPSSTQHRACSIVEKGFHA